MGGYPEWVSHYPGPKPWDDFPDYQCDECEYCAYELDEDDWVDDDHWKCPACGTINEVG